MAAETAGVERALGAIGTTFRLMRLYPPTHPAVVEALKQIGEAIPGLAALGTVEWKVGVTGLHWHGQHLLPRNAQIAELAGLLYARGVRAVTLNPGMAPDHVLALFQVATGAVPPDDGTLGRITLTLGRRTSARLERLRTPTPASGAPAIPEPSAESSPPTAVTTEQSTAAAVDCSVVTAVGGLDSADGSGIAGAPDAGVGVRSRSSRAEVRRPNVRVIRPSAPSSGGTVPVATWNSASTWSGTMPGLRVTARTPRAYNRPASSAICALRGSRCWPCQCKPVTPTFHSTVPSAARPGIASPICFKASTTAGCVGG